MLAKLKPTIRCCCDFPLQPDHEVHTYPLPLSGNPTQRVP